MTASTTPAGLATAPAPVRPKVLLVDDDPRILAGLRRQLHRRFQVFTAESGSRGLEALAAEGNVAVVVSDMRMPGMDGATFLSRVRAESPQSTRVLLTGQTELGAAIRAINDGQIFRFLNKPCPPEVLDKCLLEAVVRYQAAQDEHRLLSTVLGDRRVMETHGMYEAIATGLQVRPPNREFRLQYQPIVDLATSRPVAVQAVVRWAHPEGGLVQESAFVPAGETRGLHMPLGRWMMAAACQEVASWPALASDALRVHIKMSDGQLRDPLLADDLASTLIVSGLEPHRVTLEIVEGPALDEPAASSFLRTAAQWGSQTALVARDGGDAFAGLIGRLHVDAIKLDRLFTPTSAGYANGTNTIESIVDAARQAHVSIIAEDVDTAERQVMARTLGCGFAQGRLFGPPADPGDLLASLARTAAEWPS